MQISLQWIFFKAIIWLRLALGFSLPASVSIISLTGSVLTFFVAMRLGSDVIMSICSIVSSIVAKAEDSLPSPYLFTVLS